MIINEDDDEVDDNSDDVDDKSDNSENSSDDSTSSDEDNIPLSLRGECAPAPLVERSANDALYTISDSDSDQNYPLPSARSRRKKRKREREKAEAEALKKKEFLRSQRLKGILPNKQYKDKRKRMVDESFFSFLRLEKEEDKDDDEEDAPKEWWVEASSSAAAGDQAAVDDNGNGKNKRRKRKRKRRLGDDEGDIKWTFLEHKGPVFAPEYEPLPPNIKMKYDGKAMTLSQDAEEIAGLYAKLLRDWHVTKDRFNQNFFKDWRKAMTQEEREVITDFSKCDFGPIHEFYERLSELEKNIGKREKRRIEEENKEIENEYGFCIVDGNREKIDNFRIEPPRLYMGQGPSMGKFKKRILPEDVIINCSKGSKVPKLPKGKKWKEVRHDNTMAWLASWWDDLQGRYKYMLLDPFSKVRKMGEREWKRYEKARELAKRIEEIRENYKKDFESEVPQVRQLAVAVYFIDRLAMKLANERDEDLADTVGCCCIRVQHIQLHEEKDGKENVVTFNVPDPPKYGKGPKPSHYFNEVPVEKRVFENLKLMVEDKKPEYDLFDRLNPTTLNKHLNELMEGLTPRVFRTYQASLTLQQQLEELTPKSGTIEEKLLAFKQAKKAVLSLCKNFLQPKPSLSINKKKSTGNPQNQIEQEKRRDDLKDAKMEGLQTVEGPAEHEMDSKQSLQEQLMILDTSKTNHNDVKESQLGFVKLNYFDPRVTVAWFKKHHMPVEKVFPTMKQRVKFRWAIEMTEEDFKFD